MDTVQTDTVQVKLPVDWRELIKARAGERGNVSTADYILGLIADDIEPQVIDEQTERLIVEGLESPLDGPVDAHFWAERRQKLEDAIKAKAS